MAKVTTPLIAQERVILFLHRDRHHHAAVGITAQAMQSMAIRSRIADARRSLRSLGMRG